MTQSVMTDNLTEQLRKFVEKYTIVPDPEFKVYASGVHAVVDCVFSAQLRFSIVEKALRQLEQRLPDEPTLTFSRFSQDIQSLGEERYAAEVLTRHRIGEKLKVAISRQVVDFFSQRDYHTRADFQLPEDLESETAKKKTGELEQLILVDLVSEIYGIGPVLSRYLLMLLGDERHVKPDTLLVRLLSEIGEGKLRGDHPEDMELIRQAVTAVAYELETTPARLDNALWKYESIGRKPLPWLKGRAET